VPPANRTPLHRHQLALLTDAGWQHVLALAWDAQARDCLTHWAQERWPLVVTRQRAQAHLPLAAMGQAAHGDDAVCLGLPAPGRWDRRRMACAVPRQGIARFDAFPAASALQELLDKAWRPRWRLLCEALSASGATARVYGSHGWQLLTGLDHLRPGSDIDLCIPVGSPAQADAVAALLQRWPDGAPRLDGELVFDDGSAVAWREWCTWRAGRTPSVLVKRLDGVALAHAPFWPVAEMEAPRAPCSPHGEGDVAHATTATLVETA
jgi:phosphoribosyl-dephospho-CoA transferase